MNDFEKAFVENDFTAGKNKITTEDIIARYPVGFHINGFDIRHDEDGNAYAIFTISEDESVFAFGGDKITEAVLGWINMYGDIETANTKLASVGGAHVKMSKEKTRAGRNYTKVTFAGTK